MPLLLHFLSKQMILAELTGNMTEAESWKSLCHISLQYLCEERSAKKLQPTLVWLLVAAIYQSQHSSRSSLPKERQQDDTSFCKRTFCPISGYT